MDNKKNGIPKLRFPGFTGAWEQRKLGDIAVIFDGTHQTPKYTDSGIKFVSVENIATLETEKYISQKAYENEYSNKQAEKGDILMTRIGNIGTAKIIEKDEPLAYYVTLALLKPQNIDSNFLVWGISSPEVQRNIWKLTLHIAFPKKINLGEINQVTINIPSSSEQKKIGEFFQQLDSLIALHQRKLEHLQEQKKGLLQKMFPKTGEIVPEVRFPGFTDAWEQRKFSEILAKSDGLRRGPFGSALKKEFFISSSEYTVYEQNNAIYNTWKTRYFITPEKFQELHKFQLVPGDFILSGAGTIGRIAQVPANITKGVFNQALIRIRINPEWMDKNFFLIWMQSENMQRKLTQANPGSAMTNLVPMSEIKKWEIIIPSKAEQNKIGEFIQKLNSLITLHQRKLDHLELMKKGLLQQMFV